MSDYIKKIALVLVACAFSAQAKAEPIVATWPPAAQLVRLVAPELQPICLVAGGDPHTTAPTPKALARARGARLVVRLGVLDERWALPEAPTVVLFPRHVHGWLDPAAVKKAIQRLRAALPEASDPEGAIREVLAAWQKRLAQLGIEAAVLEHSAWAPWLEAAGIHVIAVLDEEGTGAHTPKTLEAARRALGRYRNVLFVAEPGRAHAALDWLAGKARGRAWRVALDPIGRCDESWRAHLLRELARIGR